MQLSLQQVENLARLISANYGYNIAKYDRVFMQRRLQSFAQQQGYQNFTQLQQQLLQDEIVLRDFTEHMMINVSEMFRDPMVFKMLREEILPYIASYPQIRIWSAGCAEGQEIYSLAILLIELGIYERCVLYATDTNPEVLKRASAGEYELRDAVRYTENYYLSGGKQKFSRYFSTTNGRLKVQPELCQNICFASHNMITDASFNVFSLILCRNMLIYFDAQLQQRALLLCSNSLEKHGFLVLGKSESLINNSGYQQFTDYSYENRIFKPLENLIGL